MTIKPPPACLSLRAVEMEGRVWFIARDVCAALGIPKSKAERLGASMVATIKDDEGHKALAVNADGLLCLLHTRALRSGNAGAFTLGSSMHDPEGRTLHETAPASWPVVHGAKGALQAVNVAWPAEAAHAGLSP